MLDAGKHLSATGTCTNSINDMDNILMPESRLLVHLALLECDTLYHQFVPTSLSPAALYARIWLSSQ
jgi:hypothetical protein